MTFSGLRGVLPRGPWNGGQLAWQLREGRLRGSHLEHLLPRPVPTPLSANTLQAGLSLGKSRLLSKSPGTCASAPDLEGSRAVWAPMWKAQTVHSLTSQRDRTALKDQEASAHGLPEWKGGGFTLQLITDMTWGTRVQSWPCAFLKITLC